MQRVAEYIMFLTRQSVHLSVSPVFFCQRNSSVIAQQNLVKLCSNEVPVHDVHIGRKF